MKRMKIMILEMMNYKKKFKFYFHINNFQISIPTYKNKKEREKKGDKGRFQLLNPIFFSPLKEDFLPRIKKTKTNIKFNVMVLCFVF